MGFQDFLGNTATVTQLRESVRAERFPHSLILAGPRGAGKYTLALMLARAVNCLNPTESDGLPDFCGRCRNCERIGDAANLEERVAEAVAAREEMRDADKRETRILIQTHPDVLIVPPDPPQLLIKTGPGAAGDSCGVLPAAGGGEAGVHDFYLVGVYEGGGQQPVESAGGAAGAHVADSADGESARAAADDSLAGGGAPAGRAAGGGTGALLAERRPELKAHGRALAARLAEGAVGRALTLDLGVYLASRQDALVVLRTALREPDYSQLFHATESYRGGADGQEKTMNLLRALGSLVEDLLLVVAGTPAAGAQCGSWRPSWSGWRRGSRWTGSTARRVRWCRWSRECGETCCGRCRWTRWLWGCGERVNEAEGFWRIRNSSHGEVGVARTLPYSQSQASPR